MKGKQTRPARALRIASAVTLGTLLALATSAGCIAESADEAEAEAAPPITALGFQPDLPRPPPSIQSETSKNGTGSGPTPKPSQVDTPSDANCPGADPEPSPWMPGTTPQEAHVK
jgi:hypothetical protein